MEVEIIKADKNEADVKVDDLTVAEILRVYLNEEGVDLAVWRREHPSRPALFKIKSSGKSVKKAVSDAVAAIKKDLEEIEKGLKKK